MRNKANNCIARYFCLTGKLFKKSSAANFIQRANSSFSSNDDRAQRDFLFTQEQKRQHEAIGRIEKINVEYKGLPEEVVLAMNKDVSTPYNCAQHMSETVVKRSALAVVNGAIWDMHRPLESDCELSFLNFQDPDPYNVNKAFWRTCSMILGAVAETCFKSNVPVKLHSFPSPNVRSGSFVYDVDIALEDWKPSADELRIISSEMVRLCRRELRLERLSVTSELAARMFADNPHKLAQVPLVAAQHGGRVTVYRCGDHVDISRGPMVSDTGMVGRCTIASVHKLNTDQGNLYRFQGVALPKGFLLNHFAYGILEDRAKKLNTARLPSSEPLDFQPHLAVAQ